MPARPAAGSRGRKESDVANPTALLNTIRQLVRQIERQQLRSAHVTTAVADDLAYCVAALDEQLSAGAALPREWNVLPSRTADVEAFDLDRDEFVRLGRRFTRLIPPYDRGRAHRRARRGH